MNAISVLFPYKYEGMWMFDDPETGLKREPFVFGIDEMIIRTVAGIADAEKGFRLLFAPTPFPGFTLKLDWRREEHGGNWFFARSWILRDGYAPLCSNTLTRLRLNSMPRRNRKPLRAEIKWITK